MYTCIIPRDGKEKEINDYGYLKAEYIVKNTGSWHLSTAQFGPER